MRVRHVGAAGVAMLVAAAGLAGCSSLPLPIVAPPAATDPAPARQHAQNVLARWADAVGRNGGNPTVTPVGELTGQIGDWEAAVGDNNKRALMAGLVASVEPLGDVAPADGTVTFEDGTSVQVPLLAAQAALAAVGSVTEPSCEGCEMLLITDARLSTGPIQTTRGPATAPIWEFAVRGSDVKVTRLALASPVVVQPLEASSELGLAIDSASGTVAGNELTVAFVGAPDPGDQPCGEDYTAEAVESDLAVTVIVTRHPHIGAAPVACPAVGARRSAAATLQQPLGDRTVLDFQSGTPIPLVVLP
jgi:hypothetical protein